VGIWVHPPPLAIIKKRWVTGESRGGNVCRHNAP
jgi:hypothetical protein